MYKITSYPVDMWEDVEVACEWADINPCLVAAAGCSIPEEREAVFNRVYDWYEPQFKERGLEVMNMGGHGFHLFPLGARVWQHDSQEWVVPRKYIFTFPWHAVKAFLKPYAPEKGAIDV